ncbi:MAG: hypothetical protein IKQ46_13935 [Bacteroidales bacterium]|nr:hypothetical protein [Bacteroidales bacterium]
MIIVSKILFDKVLRRYNGITIFPFIILKQGKNELDDSTYKILINHEKIHLRQQLETFIIFFYPLYLFFYLKNRLKGFSHFKSYQMIPFEIESYRNERNLNYLKNRKAYSWWKICDSD